MHVNPYLIIEGEKYLVDDFTFGFSQKPNAVGLPATFPVFQGLDVIIRGHYPGFFLERWACASIQPKLVELVLKPLVLGSGPTRVFTFFDAHLVHFTKNYSEKKNPPVEMHLKITAGGVRDSFSKSEYSAPWRETFEKPSLVAARSTTEEEYVDARQEELTPKTKCIPLKEAKEIALKVSGAYEGKTPSYNSLAGNFDGAGMSWGIIQFNFGQGTLSKLLKEMIAKDKTKFDNCFNNRQDLSALTTALSSSTSAQKQWAITMQTNHNARWRSIFNKLAAIPEFQEIQLKQIEKYDNAVIAIIKWMKSIKPNLMREVALYTFVALHDLVVQQGSISKVKSDIISALQSNSPVTQKEFITMVVTKRAMAASPRWRADCLSRRIGIINQIASKQTVSGYTSKRVNTNFKLIKKGHICDI